MERTGDVNYQPCNKERKGNTFDVRLQQMERCGHGIRMKRAKLG